MKERAPIIVKFDKFEVTKRDSSVKRFVDYLGYRKGSGGHDIPDPSHPGQFLFQRPPQAKDRWLTNDLGTGNGAMCATLRSNQGQSVLMWSCVISLDSDVAKQIPPEDWPSFLNAIGEETIENVRTRRHLGEIPHASIYHDKTNSQGLPQPHLHIVFAGSHINEETDQKRDFLNFEKGTSKHFTMWRKEADRSLDVEMRRRGLENWQDYIGPPRGSVEAHLKLIEEIQAQNPPLEIVPDVSAAPMLVLPAPSYPTLDEVFGLASPALKALENDNTLPTLTLMPASGADIIKHAIDTLGDDDDVNIWVERATDLALNSIKKSKQLADDAENRRLEKVAELAYLHGDLVLLSSSHILPEHPGGAFYSAIVSTDDGAITWLIAVSDKEEAKAAALPIASAQPEGIAYSLFDILEHNVSLPGGIDRIRNMAQELKDVVITDVESTIVTDYLDPSTEPDLELDDIKSLDNDSPDLDEPDVDQRSFGDIDF